MGTVLPCSSDIMLFYETGQVVECLINLTEFQENAVALVTDAFSWREQN